MKRVVITGLGIVSSIGNNKQEVTESLKAGKSGISFSQQFADMNLRSHVWGNVEIDQKALIDRKALRFMGDAGAFAYVAMAQAIEDAGLTEEQYSHHRVGLVAGSGGASSLNQVQAADTLREKGVKRVGPYVVPKIMSSTSSACLATPFKIKGVNYSISSACATSAHCIGHAAELIQLGKQDIVFAGGSEEIHWTLTMGFDAMGALSTKYNDNPTQASRTYDADRDGFVISGGGGILVLEDYDHAVARGAKIYAEVVGYGATSDGYDMVAPSGEGAVRCMRMAMDSVDGKIDYINTHGTSTPVGDMRELQALKEVFADNMPDISATKAMTGHALGAAGVHEAIYSLIMLENNFVAPSINVDNLDADADAEGMPIITERKDVELKTVMSNSFGFGGTNATLVMQKLD
ncbi:beta-ketoacyl-ACP synthase I [Paraferrimonas haliotis]|uniref:3-oxoacyl-[acyl-carrier-protein] synthase 1 n=1 Tax=Paraferrimonas haliotis TaxID=2013866 RepID=A0AA37TK10_9GAMM|nr:beta-ketoacyl-ACP synthase I [Paraferrimonas haliotis]GLS82604.1 beta-ketoacyl-[acyl-carrier-protein] synthase I [Paraferrimonas haliotis]